MVTYKVLPQHKILPRIHFCIVHAYADPVALVTYSVVSVAQGALFSE